MDLKATNGREHSVMIKHRHTHTQRTLPAHKHHGLTMNVPFDPAMAFQLLSIQDKMARKCLSTSTERLSRRSRE